MPVTKVKGGYLPFPGSKAKPTTKEKATKQLRAIKANQARRGKRHAS